MRYIFAIEGGFKVVADNFQLRMEGDRVNYQRVNDIIERMRGAELWSDKGLWETVVSELPEYRLSKFQRALPARFSEEMVMEYLLDVKGARRMVEAAVPQQQADGEL